MGIEPVPEFRLRHILRFHVFPPHVIAPESAPDASGCRMRFKRQCASVEFRLRSFQAQDFSSLHRGAKKARAFPWLCQTMPFDSIDAVSTGPSPIHQRIPVRSPFVSAWAVPVRFHGVKADGACCHLHAAQFHFGFQPPVLRLVFVFNGAGAGAVCQGGEFSSAQTLLLEALELALIEFRHSLNALPPPQAALSIHFENVRISFRHLGSRIGEQNQIGDDTALDEAAEHGRGVRAGPKGNGQERRGRHSGRYWHTNAQETGSTNEGSEDFTGFRETLAVNREIRPDSGRPTTKIRKKTTMPNDYMPARNAEFALWLANFAALVAAAPLSYGLTVPDAVAITTQDTAYQAAYLLSTNPATRTAATVATTQGARFAAEAVVRPYAMRINANQTVTDAQRSDLGITIRTVTPTPVPPPLTSPALMLVAATPGIHTIQVRDSLTPTSKAKPENVAALELWVAVGVAPAVDPSAGAFRQLTTKTPFQVAFEAPDKGKIATYFGRWVNRSGTAGIAARGPWSAPISSHII